MALGGPEWADLSELVPFADQIEELNIDCPVADMSHLGALPRLRELYLGYEAQPENVDLPRLHGLETLRLAHRSSCDETIASAFRVKALYIQNCGLRDLTPLQNLSKLEYLNVGEAPLRSLNGMDGLRSLRALVLSQVPVADLEGIDRLATLEELWLHATPRLSSIAPLAELKTLRKLSIYTTRKGWDLTQLGRLTRLDELHLEGGAIPTSIDFVSGLKSLRVLTLRLAGRIPSLHFLTALKKLERLVLGEKLTIGDGDLSVLLKLPALHVAAFRDRSHYSHRRKEIDAALAGRGS